MVFNMPPLFLYNPINNMFFNFFVKVLVSPGTSNVIACYSLHKRRPPVEEVVEATNIENVSSLENMFCHYKSGA